MEQEFLGFEIADEVAEESNKKGTRYNWFKPIATPKQIRFIAVDDNTILSYSEHFVTFNNTWNRAFSCPDFRNDGPSTCIICKVKAGKNGDVKENNFGNKFLMQVIERDAKDPDPETKQVPTEGTDTLKVFKFSPFLYTTLSAYHKEHGTLGDRDYNISLIKPIVNGKQKIAYIVEPVTKKAVPLTEADRLIIAGKAALKDIKPVYDEAEFNRLQALTTTSGIAEPVDVKSTISEFLGSLGGGDVDDIIGSLPRAEAETTNGHATATVTDTVAEDTEEDSDEKAETAEFFKTLRKHKAAK